MSDGGDRAIHVALDAHLLSLAESYRSAGISWYIQNLLRHLPQADPGIRYTAFLSEGRYSGDPMLRLQRSHLPTHHPVVRIFWEQAIQPVSLRRVHADLLHGLALVGPLLSACPFVVTVHDLSFLHFPQNFAGLKRIYLRTLTRLSVQQARRVIAISENTRRDIVQWYGVQPEKVDLVYYGLDPRFHTLSADQVSQFRSGQGLPERFILFVGTLEPRKNVTRLIEAYARLPRDRPPLLLVGGKGWLYDEIFSRAAALDLTGEVRFVGYVPSEQLPWWYNAAELFVYPSMYEGFGLPPLEAMACGTPVITASTSSLPEVVGQAGMTVEPTDTEALASAMALVLSSRETREKMRAAGLERAQAFSWKDTALRTVDSYRRALGEPGGGTSV